MFGIDFYPTPLSVIKKMLEPYESKWGYRLSDRTILEPSAGKGNIADIINSPDAPKYERKVKLDCLEIDPKLVAILQQNGHRVVGNDFLSWKPDKMYDIIMMNPPFSQGDKHLLHAWNCLQHGEIICLLNMETISNPNSKRKKLLNEIIRKFGSVEELGACFSKSERHTNVNVALVRLKKDQVDQHKAMFDKAKLSRFQQEKVEKPEDINLPATRNLVKTLVLQYNETLVQFKQTKILAARLDSSLKAVRGKGLSSSYGTDGVKKLIFDPEFSRSYNEFVEQLTNEAWRNVISLCGLEHLMTKQVRASFEDNILANMTLAFTEANIYALLDGLRHNVDSIMTEALGEVFDYLTRYHKENRVYVEGWKTNDRFKVGKKFILPNIVTYDYQFRFAYYARDEALVDIDRVMCSLEGKKVEDVVTICDALRSSFGEENPGWIESEFFQIRYYKKGTVHFVFKDDSLRERFCIEYAKEKNWLPRDYNYREHGPILELGGSKQKAA